MDVVSESTTERKVALWLQTLGIQSLSQWDVLVYIYCRRNSLLDTEQISHLLGYELNVMVEASAYLDSLGLVECSPARRGVRLWRLAVPAETLHREALQQLLNLKDWYPVRRVLAAVRSGAPLVKVQENDGKD